MIQAKGKFLTFQITGVEQLAEKLSKMTAEQLPREEIFGVVQNQATNLQDKLKSAFSPYVNTGELQRSITIYRRKKKDYYYTYFVGPQYSGNKSQQINGKSAAGNAAHFLEYGTVDRYVANQGKGGVSRGKGRIYGAKSYRGRVAPIGLIRRTIAENHNPIVTSLVNNIGKILEKWYSKNGFRLGHK